ncbi:MFS general substrate transporter [Hymenopellis radicata]|nr:MFS general substrate transporter [Hymenopellis radicata]
MTVLIIGRAIQGLGSGGIQTLTTIIVSDLVPLKERGLFNGITGATFTVATSAGPFLGGAIVQNTTWRWFVFLVPNINLPLAGIAISVVLAFLKLRKPSRPSAREVLGTVDWIGNTIIIASTASCVIALTWAGIKFPWTSFHVLCPLTIGVVGLFSAVLYDIRFASYPTIPLRILSNRTSVSGYVASAIHAMVITSINFVLSPAAIVQGLVIAKFGCYRLMNALGWCLLLLGIWFGISIPSQILTSIGLGFLYATTFSVLAPLDVTDNAAALSFLLFCRTFPQSWSVSIGASVLQNKLRSTLPATFIQQFASNEISHIQCREAFSDSLHLLWKILLIFCALGLISVGFQRGIDLHAKTDSRWGMADTKDKPPTDGPGTSDEQAEKKEEESAESSV